MAQIIRFDDGIEEYQVNDNGLLRLNASDPNLYQRFFDAKEKLLAIEQHLEEKGKQVPAISADASPAEKEKAGAQTLRLMADADRQVKEVLNWVFPGNDFDQLLGSANTMAVGANGERIVTNLMNALVPIVEKGVRTYANGKAQQMNRSQRRAGKKHRKGHK